MLNLLQAVCLPVDPMLTEQWFLSKCEKGRLQSKNRKIILERSLGPNIDIAIEIEHTLTAKSSILSATIQQ